MTQRTTLAAFRRSIPALALSLALFACSDDANNGNNEKIEGNSLLLNFTSDYTTGELRWMHPDSARLSGAIAFSQDSRVSAAKSNIFVLSNSPGVLSCILPEQIGDESAIKQVNLGDVQSPYEATVIGSKGYIALNDADYIQVFNVSTCTLDEKIDLPISGAGASTIKASGDTLLLTLQRLENWSATKPGLLVRIRADGSIIDTLQLKLKNPNSSLLNNGTLIVSSSNWGLGDDGIEIVDLAKGTSEILADNAKLGGGVSDIALDEANQILYASVYVSWGDSPVKSINLATKTVGNALPNILDAAGGLVFDKAGKKLFVGDQSGLIVYDPVANTTAAIGNQDPLLPPYSLAIVNF